jgi:phage terminase small subunit
MSEGQACQADISDHEERFAEQFLVDLNGTQAMLRVRPGITRQSAAVQASRMLGRQRVLRRVAELKEQRAKRLQLDADAVVARLWWIATADVNELVSVHVLPCPACRGPVAAVGGVRDEAPDPNCAECRGDGRPVVVIRDTRHLSPAAAALYAGVRAGPHGIEVLLQDRVKALDLVGQHLGLWGSAKNPKIPPASQDPIQDLLNELRHQHAAAGAAHETGPATLASSDREKKWRPARSSSPASPASPAKR